MKGDRWMEGAEAMNIAWGTATPNPASEFQFYPPGIIFVPPYLKEICAKIKY